MLAIVLACVATVLCYRVFLQQYDRGLRNAVVTHLLKTFPASRIHVGRVIAETPDKIVVSDLRLFNRASRDQEEVFSAQRIEILGDFDITDWAQQTICVKQIVIHGALLSVWPQADDQWSVQALRPTAKPEGAASLEIVFQDAMLALFQGIPAESQSIVLHNINGSLGPKRLNADAPEDKDCELELSGGSSGLLDSFSVSGYYSSITKEWQASGSVNSLYFSPELLDKLPVQLSQRMTQLGGLECSVTCGFKLASRSSQVPRFLVRGSIQSGELEDDRLPYPLDDIHGGFYCDNAMLQLRELAARSGSTQFVVSADIAGFSPRSPVEIRATARDMELDRRLYGSLPQKLRDQWDKLQLDGQVSGEITLSYDGQTWTPSAILRCNNLSLNPWLFPYPVTKISGPVTYQNGTVSSSGMVGSAGGQGIAASFSLSQQDGEWIGWLQGNSAGPIAIDEQLVAALTPSGAPTTPTELFVRSLHPTGTVQVKELSLRRTTAQQANWSRTLDANIFNANLNYDAFPYPIHDVRGRIYGQDNNWVLDQFEGRNDSGSILCSGSWQAVSSGPLPFKLKFDAFALPLEEELKKALPTDTQQVWAELQPSGSVDRVQVLISRSQEQESVQTFVNIEEDSASNSDSGRSLRIKPRSFPYPLSDVACEIAYTSGLVSIKRVSGSNGSSRIALHGQCTPRSDGRWQASVEWLPRTRLVVDRLLLNALPRSIRDSLVKIDFRGPISVMGKSQIVFANDTVSSPLTNWDCNFDIENGQLGDGKTISDMRGTVWMQGASDGSRLDGSGILSMDAMTVKGIPISSLRGPFALRGSNLFFGENAVQVEPTLANPYPQLTSKALAGQLILSGQGSLSNLGEFHLDANLLNAELNSLLQDVGVNQASAQALCNASLKFDGIPWSTHTWSGEGNIHLSDAKLFQLPFMIRLLRAASVNAKDDSAFQSADIEFAIDGDRIPLKIACDGDALRLRGEGWTDLHRNVELQLYSYVGRRPISSLVSDIIPESPYATFLMIEVNGTLDNPNMQRRTFPQFSAVQQMFPELAEPPGKRRLIPWRQ